MKVLLYLSDWMFSHLFRVGIVVLPSVVFLLFLVLEVVCLGKPGTDGVPMVFLMFMIAPYLISDLI